MKKSGSDLDRERRIVRFGRFVNEHRNDTNISTIMHEVAHQLSFNCGLLNRTSDVPVWLAEGLAVYCESTIGGAWQGVGEVNPQRAGVLARAVNNEDEAYGRNAGEKRHYYRVAFPLADLWPQYAGSPNDGLRIEIFETWLERSRA